MSFFVLGLPRSRTAWLSVFLSQSGIHCHHEAVNGCHNIDEYAEKIKGCGDSTTAFKYINNRYDGRPTVVIDKNDIEFEQCVAWCKESFGVDMRREMAEQRDQLLSIDGLHVMQSDIDANLPEIFEILTCVDFLPHYADMTSLNITSRIDSTDIHAMREFING
jgi:hypothetical protein